MKAVFYDSERNTITFEPGVTWADAVAGLESEGVAAVGARFRCDVIDLCFITRVDLPYTST